MKSLRSLATVSALTLLGLTLGACAHNPPGPGPDVPPHLTKEPPPPPPRPSMVEVAGAGKSKVKGTLAFSPDGDQIHVVGEFSGLKAKTEHGLHVHENGDCKGPKFESAGGHYNPSSTEHGAPEGKMRHAGDLGNVTSDKKGNARIDIMIPANPNGDMFGGRSLILHAKMDDEHTQPSGDSGDRIACGLIKQQR